MENSIDYQKVETVDENIIKLLKKLDGVKPFGILIKEIENKYYSIIQVFFNSKSCGILLIRGEIDFKGNFHLVVAHAIADDNLVKTFSEVLGYSLFEFAKAKGARFIRQHADKKGLCRMLEKYYGDPVEYVYQKDLNECLLLPNQNKQASNQPQVMTNE